MQLSFVFVFCVGSGGLLTFTVTVQCILFYRSKRAIHGANDGNPAIESLKTKCIAP
jgi:hypothetical protein